MVFGGGCILETLAINGNHVVSKGILQGNQIILSTKRKAYRGFFLVDHLKKHKMNLVIDWYSYVFIIVYFEGTNLFQAVYEIGESLVGNNASFRLSTIAWQPLSLARPFPSVLLYMPCACTNSWKATEAPVEMKLLLTFRISI